MKFNKIKQKLIEKAWNDEDFKKNFVESPIATLEKMKGEKFPNPDNITLIVEDQSDPNTIYLNIPPNFTDSGELTPEQLEAVVGGLYEFGKKVGRAYIRSAVAVGEWLGGIIYG